MARVKPEQLKLTAINGKKVNKPKGTKYVQSTGGNLNYLDKNGKPISAKPIKKIPGPVRPPDMTIMPIRRPKPGPKPKPRGGM